MKRIKYVGLLKAAGWFGKSKPAKSSAPPIGEFVEGGKGIIPQSMMPLAKKVEGDVKDIPSRPDIKPDADDISLMEDIGRSPSTLAMLTSKGSSKFIKSVYPEFWDAIDSSVKGYAFRHPIDSARAIMDLSDMVPDYQAVLSGGEGAAEAAKNHDKYVKPISDALNANTNVRDILYSGLTNNYARINREYGMNKDWDALKAEYAKANPGDKIKFPIGGIGPEPEFTKSNPRQAVVASAK